MAERVTQQSIKRNTVFNAIKTASSILFPLITFPYISRVLLPENVGKINFGLSIVSYFSLIASLGITTYAIRECSAVREDKDKLSNIASQIYSINIITTIVAYVALAFTLVFYHKLENYRILIVIQSLTIIAMTLGADWLNSAMEDFRYITVRTVVFQLVSLVLMFIFVHQPEDYMKYAVISMVSSAGASVSNIWYRRRYCDVRFIWDIMNGIEWKRHMIPIIYLFVMILAQTLFNSVDITMIGLLKGDVEVGIYSTAHKVANLIVQVVVSSAWVVMPRMSNYFADRNYEAINMFLKKVLGYFALLGLPCIIGTICVSEELVQIIAGEEYLGAIPVLQILMIGFVFDLFGNSFIGNIICLPLKEEKKYTAVWIIASLINIVLNYFLIPLYGSRAAALTTAFSYIFSLVALLLVMNRRIKIEGYLKILISPIVGCLAIIVLCGSFGFIGNMYVRVIVKVIAGGAAYTIIQCMLKNKFIFDLMKGVKALIGR